MKANRKGRSKKKLSNSKNKAKKEKAVLKNNIQSQKWWQDKKILFALGGVGLLTIISFSPIFGNDFTNWDDNLYVTANHLMNDLSFSGISEIFTTEVVSNYHPLTILSLAVNHQISGLNPTAFLSTNLLLHLFNTIFVFIFIYSLSEKKPSVAIISSLFFGIHPMHVESVAWISERKDVLYTFFFLLGLIGYLKHLEKPDIKKYSIVLILFFCSLLSKPAAVVFPIVLLLIDYYKSRDLNMKLIVEKIPFFILTLFFAILTYNIQSGSAMDVGSKFNLPERLLFACYGFITYIFKFFIPYNLSALHPFPESGNLPQFFYLFPFLVLLISGLILKLNNKTLTFGLLFYFISIAPVLQFITIGNALVAERYTYVPYIGLLFILGHLFYYLDNKNSTPTYLYKVIIGTAAIVFTILSFHRTSVWENSNTLWTDVIEKYPESNRAYMSRGNYFMDNQKYDEALSDFNYSLNINPNYYQALESRGNLHIQMKNYDSAIDDFTLCIGNGTNKENLYVMRGMAFSKSNKINQALSDYNKALELNPQYPIAYNGRGTLYFNKLKEYNKALNDFNQAISLDPKLGTSYLNRSRCYYMLSQKSNAYEEAMKAQQLGIEIPPSYLKLIQ